MAGPSFAHLSGRPMWSHCDHDRTRIEGAPPAVCLAPAQGDPAAGGADTDLAAWQAVLGSALLWRCPPDQCLAERPLLLDPLRGLLTLGEAGWLPLATPPPPLPPSGALHFAPLSPPPPPSRPSAIALDPWGRLWLLERAARRLTLLRPDLQVEASLRLPAGIDPIACACSATGLLLADGAAAQILHQPWGGEWQGYRPTGLSAAAEILALAADPAWPLGLLLLRDGAAYRLLQLDGAGASLWPLALLDPPLHLLVTGPDSLLLSQPTQRPGAPLPTQFRAFQLTAEGPRAGQGYGVRAFDGRALWRHGERLLASTAKGARALYPLEQRLQSEGVVESWALDSGIFACRWHRLFLDCCVPPDCTLTLEVKCADQLPPLPLRRQARPPADQVAAVAPAPATDPWPPLGSLEPEEADGWITLGVADRRPGLADQSLPPATIQRASEDPLKPQRVATAPPPTAMQTWEWLLPAPPGRYLWVRIRLHGSGRRGPTLFALRASFPRQSLLDYLPAFWRADPEGAEASDRALALFESFTSELDQRTDALLHLFDPGLTPASALPWLASFLALTFDQRVGEAVRRQLLSEIALLYRQRGTLPGLRRLLSILAQAQVQIIEGFRLRRPTAAFVEGAAIGPGLELGGAAGPFGFVTAEPVERELRIAHQRLLERRALAEPPCPAAAPPDPLVDDPLIAFYRRHAHRFTVLLPIPCDQPLAAVIELATEQNKPAHTLHRLCWLETGFRLGSASLVGISALGAVAAPAPAVLGEATLSSFTTLHRPGPSSGYRTFHRTTSNHMDSRGQAL